MRSEGSVRQDFVLFACLVLSVGGCDSGASVESEQAGPDHSPVVRLTWGLSESEEFQNRLCDATGAFSARIDFANDPSDIAPEVFERVLCGLPRSRMEPKSYEVFGKVLGTAFTRTGEIADQCEYRLDSTSADDDSHFTISNFICSGPPVDINVPWPESLSKTLAIYLEDFSDSKGNIRTQELNSEIARVATRGVARLVVPLGTFRTEETIRSSGSIILDGAGVGVSKIVGTSPEMRSILEVDPSHVEELELSVSAAHGSEVLHVDGTPQIHWQNNCSRIVIRDTSQIWPWDARDYVFFGEVVDVVQAYQGLIVLSEATRDTYFRGAKVSFICPSGVLVRDISLKFTNPVLGTKALSITGGDPVTVTDVEIENSGRAAIWIAESTNVLVTNSIMRNGFPPNCDTCYGVQTYGSQDVLVENNSIVEFRRAIDISGAIPSRRVMIRDNFASAESDTVRAASGMGTHGSADGVIFTDNVVTGGIVSILLRGNEIAVFNNRLMDAEYSSVYLDSGGNHYLDGNHLGGTRVNGRPTIRGVEFHVTSGHAYSKITNNLISASVGVRIAETPEQIEITGNKLDIMGVPVKLEEGVVLDDDDTVEFEW